MHQLASHFKKSTKIHKKTDKEEGFSQDLQKNISVLTYIRRILKFNLDEREFTYEEFF